MKYIKGLDSLRAIACFSVIIAHWGAWFDETTSAGKFTRYVVFPDAKLAVYTFFVLSGFLITSILLAAKTQENNNGHVLRSFLVRRGLRIYPVYYMLLLFLFAVNFPDVRENILYFATHTSNLLIYHTNSWNAFCVTWTLAVEEQIYLLWPFIILFINDRFLPVVFAILIVTGIASTYITQDVQHHIAPCLFYNCFDAFGIGGMYAYVKSRDYKVAGFERAIGVFAIAAAVLYFYWRLCYYFGSPALLLSIEKTVDCLIAVGIIMLVINNRSERVKKYFLENRFLNFAGKMSFGIYLFHDVYINGFYRGINDILNKATSQYQGINALLMERTVNYWIHIAIVLFISFASYRLIEKPLLRLKSTYMYRKPQTVSLGPGEKS